LKARKNNWVKDESLGRNILCLQDEAIEYLEAMPVFEEPEMAIEGRAVKRAKTNGHLAVKDPQRSNGASKLFAPFRVC
jgi:hypothetical protein